MSLILRQASNAFALRTILSSQTSAKSAYMQRTCGTSLLTRPLMCVALLPKATSIYGRITSTLKSSRFFNSTVSKLRRERLPFEVDSNVVKDTLIFSYRNDQLYRSLTIFGIVQFVFWCNLAMFTYGTFKDFNENDPRFDMNSNSGRMMLTLKQYSYTIAILCLLLGHTGLFFTMVFPQRSVRNLTLLKGGTVAKISTYKYFGNMKTHKVPLSNINCMQSRDSKGTNVCLKVKGRWLYFLLDKRKGKFHNTELFDHVIGLKRNIK